jgi:hypothetical protein
MRLSRAGLVGRVGAFERGQSFVDVGHRAADALAAVAFLVAVAQLDGLAAAGGRARWDCSTAETAVAKPDVHLDGGIAARIENLSGMDGCDGAHGMGSFRGGGTIASVSRNNH